MERKTRWLDRALDFIFGGLSILIGAGILSHVILKGLPGGGGDLPMVILIAAVPLIFGANLIFRPRVKPPESIPDVPATPVALPSKFVLILIALISLALTIAVMRL